MWNAFKDCIEKVFPWAGAITVALIVGGLIAAYVNPAIGLSLVIVGKIVGVAVGADVIGTLIYCITGSAFSDSPAG